MTHGKYHQLKTNRSKKRSRAYHTNRRVTTNYSPYLVFVYLCDNHQPCSSCMRNPHPEGAGFSSQVLSDDRQALLVIRFSSSIIQVSSAALRLTWWQRSDLLYNSLKEESQNPNNESSVFCKYTLNSFGWHGYTPFPATTR